MYDVLVLSIVELSMELQRSTHDTSHVTGGEKVSVFLYTRFYIDTLPQNTNCLVQSVSTTIFI